MTKEQAIELSKTAFWKDLSYEGIVKFQLFEPLLCMPFEVFHEALEKCLNRPVFTHELGLNYEGIKLEFLKEKPAPTLEEIINLIPEDKRVVLVLK